MQSETFGNAASRRRRNPRGVYEKMPGTGIWWIRYADAVGKIRREKAGAKSAALSLYHKRKTEVFQGKKLPESLRKRLLGFEEIAQDCLEYSRATKVPAAYRGDRGHMAILLSWFRDRTASEITPQEIEKKLNDLVEEGRAPATVNRYRALLSLVYSLANRNGKVSVNPARLVRLRKENNARVRFLDEREETILRRRIRSAFPHREPEFNLALHTGMRLSEQYRLQWQDVDLKRGIITIGQSKGGTKRHIPINSSAHDALKALSLAHQPSGAVCRPLKRAERRWFPEVVKQAGLFDFHWHDLRHTFASRLVMADVNIRTVQELMGHKGIGMTVRYSHLAPAHAREAVERLVQGGKLTQAAVVKKSKRRCPVLGSHTQGHQLTPKLAPTRLS